MSLDSVVVPKILIIDDDSANNALAQRYLTSVGYEVVTTESPFNTSTLITDEQPDLVLVDLRMPGLSGDALVRIAKRRGGANCPFVLYSTSDADVLAPLAKECGADGYIQKSGHMAELVREIEQYLDDG